MEASYTDVEQIIAASRANAAQADKITKNVKTKISQSKRSLAWRIKDFNLFQRSELSHLEEKFGPLDEIDAYIRMMMIQRSNGYATLRIELVPNDGVKRPGAALRVMGVVRMDVPRVWDAEFDLILDDSYDFTFKVMDLEPNVQYPLIITVQTELLLRTAKISTGESTPFKMFSVDETRDDYLHSLKEDFLLLSQVRTAVSEAYAVAAKLAFCRMREFKSATKEATAAAAKLGQLHVKFQTQLKERATQLINPAIQRLCCEVDDLQRIDRLFLKCNEEIAAIGEMKSVKAAERYILAFIELNAALRNHGTVFTFIHERHIPVLEYVLTSKEISFAVEAAGLPPGIFSGQFRVPRPSRQLEELRLQEFRHQPYNYGIEQHYIDQLTRVDRMRAFRPITYEFFDTRPEPEPEKPAREVIGTISPAVQKALEKLKRMDELRERREAGSPDSWVRPGSADSTAQIEALYAELRLESSENAGKTAAAKATVKAPAEEAAKTPAKELAEAQQREESEEESDDDESAEDSSSSETEEEPQEAAPAEDESETDEDIVYLGRVNNRGELIQSDESQSDEEIVHWGMNNPATSDESQSDDGFTALEAAEEPQQPNAQSPKAEASEEPQPNPKAPKEPQTPEAERPQPQEHKLEWNGETGTLSIQPGNEHKFPVGCFISLHCGVPIVNEEGAIHYPVYQMYGSPRRDGQSVSCELLGLDRRALARHPQFERLRLQPADGGVTILAPAPELGEMLFPNGRPGMITAFSRESKTYVYCGPDSYYLVPPSMWTAPPRPLQPWPLSSQALPRKPQDQPASSANPDAWRKCLPIPNLGSIFPSRLDDPPITSGSIFPSRLNAPSTSTNGFILGTRPTTSKDTREFTFGPTPVTFEWRKDRQPLSSSGTIFEWPKDRQPPSCGWGPGAQSTSYVTFEAPSASANFGIPNGYLPSTAFTNLGVPHAYPTTEKSQTVQSAPQSNAFGDSQPPQKPTVEGQTQQQPAAESELNSSAAHSAGIPLAQLLAENPAPSQQTKEFNFPNIPSICQQPMPVLRREAPTSAPAPNVAEPASVPTAPEPSAPPSPLPSPPKRSQRTDKADSTRKRNRNAPTDSAHLPDSARRQLQQILGRHGIEVVDHWIEPSGNSAIPDASQVPAMNIVEHWVDSPSRPRNRRKNSETERQSKKATAQQSSSNLSESSESGAVFKSRAGNPIGPKPHKKARHHYQRLRAEKARRRELIQHDGELQRLHAVHEKARRSAEAAQKQAEKAQRRAEEARRSAEQSQRLALAAQRIACPGQPVAEGANVLQRLLQYEHPLANDMLRMLIEDSESRGERRENADERPVDEESREALRQIEENDQQEADRKAKLQKQADEDHRIAVELQKREEELSDSTAKPTDQNSDTVETDGEKLLAEVAALNDFNNEVSRGRITFETLSQEFVHLCQKSQSACVEMLVRRGREPSPQPGPSGFRPSPPARSAQIDGVTEAIPFAEPMSQEEEAVSALANYFEEFDQILQLGSASKSSSLMASTTTSDSPPATAPNVTAVATTPAEPAEAKVSSQLCDVELRLLQISSFVYMRKEVSQEYNWKKMSDTLSGVEESLRQLECQQLSKADSAMCSRLQANCHNYRQIMIRHYERDAKLCRKAMDSFKATFRQQTQPIDPSRLLDLETEMGALIKRMSEVDEMNGRLGACFSSYIGAQPHSSSIITAEDHAVWQQIVEAAAQWKPFMEQRERVSEMCDNAEQLLTEILSCNWPQAQSVEYAMYLSMIEDVRNSFTLIVEEELNVMEALAPEAGPRYVVADTLTFMRSRMEQLRAKADHISH